MHGLRASALFTSIFATLALASPAFAGTETEGNDSVGAANPVTPGDTITGTINEVRFGDIDYFAFGGSGTVTINFQNTTSPCQQTGGFVRCLERAMIVDGADNVVTCQQAQPGCDPREAQAILTSPGIPDGVTAGNTATLTFPLPSPGTYYLRVVGSDAGFTYAFNIGGAITQPSPTPNTGTPGTGTPGTGTPGTGTPGTGTPGTGTGTGATGGDPAGCAALATKLKNHEKSLARAKAELAKDQAALKKARSRSKRSALSKEIATDRKAISSAKSAIDRDVAALGDARCTCALIASELRGLTPQLATAKAALARDQRLLRRARRRSEITRLQGLVVLDRQNVQRLQNAVDSRRREQRAGGCGSG
jgi:hypothetical protein